MSDEELKRNQLILGRTDRSAIFDAVAVHRDGSCWLVSALVGPLVRNLEPEHQVRLIGVWGIWIAAIIIVIAYQARQRFEAEDLPAPRCCGCECSTKKAVRHPRARRWMNIIGAGLVLLFCMMMISGVVVDLSSRMRGGVVLWPYLGG